MAAVMQEGPKTRDEILKAFQKLVEDKKRRDARIETREEEAERRKDKELVEAASKYTVESIVKGAANLQLEFSDSLEQLANRLAEEATRLEQTRRARGVETQSLATLRHVKVSAEALDILRREHEDQLEELEQSAKTRTEALDEEVARKREEWSKEQAEFQRSVEEYNRLLTAERQRESEDYGYNLERERKIAHDEYEDKKRKLEIKYAEMEEEKEAQWKEREKKLEAVAKDLADFKAKVEAFPGQLEEAVKKAREDGIRKANEEAKVAADLLEREDKANTEVFQLKIKSLEETITRQQDQLEKLTHQLREALSQTQELAVKAIEGAGASGKQAKKVAEALTTG